MKKYAYYRSAASVGKKRKIRKTAAVSFFKYITLFFVFLLLCAGLYGLARRGYAAWSASRMGNWQPTAAAVSGADGILSKELLDVAQRKLKVPFSAQDALQLQTELKQHYPQLRQIRVQRGLLSGKLKISVKRRIPVARLTQKGKLQFMDEDGTLYSDPHPDPLLTVPAIELQGNTPENLGEEFAGFVRSVLKLKDQLEFTALQFNLQTDTVTMLLPDGSRMSFGPAKQLRQKARRAAQIRALAQKTQSQPYELDFTYFDEGKVFLRQKAL